MMKVRVVSILLLLLLAACSGPGKQSPVVQAERSQQVAQMQEMHAMAREEPEQEYPKMELTSQMLYQFLLSEIAAQRGQPELSVQGYLDLARQTRDLRAARRAAQLAYESRQMNEAIEALRLWSELEPKALLPRQMLVTVLISAGMFEEVRPHLASLLKSDPANAGRAVMQLYPLLARGINKGEVYDLMKEISQPYLDHPEMHWVLAQAASAASKKQIALDEARKARNLRPDWELAVLLEARLLNPESPEGAMKIAGEFLEKHADANELRLFYARSLLERKQYRQSREQFRVLLDKQPGNTDVAFAIALLSIQMGELDKAEEELKQTLAAGRKDASTVHFYLGQLQEAKKDHAAAIHEYRQVTEGEQAFPSQLRIAYLLSKAGKLEEARSGLQKVKPRTAQQRSELVLIEGQLLRDAGKLDHALRVISKGLESFPDHPELLYEAGMVAEKMRKFDVSEKMLRKLIKVSPDHAHAYNALGYSMLERRDRMDEAMQLVEKAHQLSPEDAAIMDSMGWGYYLTGKLAKSLEYMKRAYAVLRDAEIAAHLGEVLWQSGEKEAAKQVWQQSLKENPGNGILETVIKRFMH